MCYLDPVRHANMIKHLDVISNTSHIPVRMLEAVSVREVCTPDEQGWVLKFKKHLIRDTPDAAGMVLVGRPSGGVSPIDRMRGIGATLLRNGCDTEVLSMGTLLMDLDSPRAVAPDPKVLLIPDFWVPGMEYGKKSLTRVYSYLQRRTLESRLTVLHVEDFGGMSSEYGVAITQLLEDNFFISGASVPVTS